MLRGLSMTTVVRPSGGRGAMDRATTPETDHSRPASSESDQLLQPNDQLVPVHDLAGREEDAGDERVAARGVVADGEGLAEAAEEDLLVGDEPGHPDAVD